MRVTPGGVIEAGADPWGYRRCGPGNRSRVCRSGHSFRLDRAAVAFDRDRLRDRLNALAARGIFIGGSSWKYEGWLGQIYSRSRYQVRGRFSKKLFEDTCLSEYATVFPAVCGDFAFYQFPSDAFWAKLFRQTPETFRWGFKVPEQITVPAWPVHPRYGALAGLENPTFLDAALLEQAFLRALEPYRKQVGVLIFEFGALRQTQIAADFVKALDAFPRAIAGGLDVTRWRFAIRSFCGPTISLACARTT